MSFEGVITLSFFLICVPRTESPFPRHVIAVVLFVLEVALVVIFVLVCIFSEFSLFRRYLVDGSMDPN